MCIYTFQSFIHTCKVGFFLIVFNSLKMSKISRPWNGFKSFGHGLTSTYIVTPVCALGQVQHVHDSQVELGAGHWTSGTVDRLVWLGWGPDLVVSSLEQPHCFTAVFTDLILRFSNINTRSRLQKCDTSFEQPYCFTAVFTDFLT